MKNLYRLQGEILGQESMDRRQDKVPRSQTLG